MYVVGQYGWYFCLVRCKDCKVFQSCLLAPWTLKKYNLKKPRNKTSGQKCFAKAFRHPSPPPTLWLLMGQRSFELGWRKNRKAKTVRHLHIQSKQPLQSRQPFRRHCPKQLASWKGLWQDSKGGFRRWGGGERGGRGRGEWGAIFGCLNRKTIRCRCVTFPS